MRQTSTVWEVRLTNDDVFEHLWRFQDRLWEYIEADDFFGARAYVEDVWPALSDSLPYEVYCEMATGMLNYLGMVWGILDHEAQNA